MRNDHRRDAVLQSRSTLPSTLMVDEIIIYDVILIVIIIAHMGMVRERDAIGTAIVHAVRSRLSLDTTSSIESLVYK